MGKKKLIQEQELKEHEQNSLSSHYFVWSGFGTWRGFDSIELCLVLIALALVLNEMSEKLGCMEWWGGVGCFKNLVAGWGVGGGFLSPNPPNQPLGRLSIDGCTRQSGAPPDTVWCASHVTQPLEV
jgi:hypothetical protein